MRSTHPTVATSIPHAINQSQLATLSERDKRLQFTARSIDSRPSIIIVIIVIILCHMLLALVAITIVRIAKELVDPLLLLQLTQVRLFLVSIIYLVATYVALILHAAVDFIVTTNVALFNVIQTIVERILVFFY